MQQVELRDPSEAARQMQLLVQTAQAQGQVEAHAMHPPTQNVKLYHTALDTAEKQFVEVSKHKMLRALR